MQASTTLPLRQSLGMVRKSEESAVLCFRKGGGGGGRKGRGESEGSREAAVDFEVATAVFSR